MTLEWWQGLLLGLVQGLTEFLPVSSSGHLVLAQELLQVQPPGVYVEVGLHLATLLSVFIAYRVRIRELVAGLLVRQPEAWRYALLLVVASVPAAIAGLGFRDFFEARFESGPVIGVLFLVTATVLWLTRPALARATATRITWGAALLIGLAQAVAILPAVSRSGSTIAAALWLGIAPATAAEFSFLMSVIVIAGSGLVEARHIPPGADLLAPGFLLAFVVALLSGVWAIRFLIALLRGRRFHWFGAYCAVVGLLTILYYATRSS